MKPKRSGKTGARFLILDFDLDTNLEKVKQEMIILKRIITVLALMICGLSHVALAMNKPPSTNKFLFKPKSPFTRTIEASGDYRDRRKLESSSLFLPKQSEKRTTIEKNLDAIEWAAKLDMERVKKKLKSFERQLAACKSPKKRKEYLKKKVEGKTFLYSLVGEGYVEPIKRVLKVCSKTLPKRELLSIKNINDNTVLHETAHTHNFDITEIFLKACPLEHRSEFLKMQNSDGNTALHLAALMNAPEVAEVLFDFYSDEQKSDEQKKDLLDMKNKKGFTPWDLAKKTNNAEFLSLFLSSDLPTHYMAAYCKSDVLDKFKLVYGSK